MIGIVAGSGIGRVSRILCRLYSVFNAILAGRYTADGRWHY